jgi:hypothetical protein
MEQLTTPQQVVDFFDGKLSGNYILDLDEAEYAGYTFTRATYTEAINTL